jgi:L-lysine exporter family protein LysE/ArgO
MLSPFFAASAKGFALGAGFIIAIGSQNAFVLQQGLLRRYITPVIAVCIGGDILLIALGAFGVGTVLTHLSWLTPLASLAGAIFLTLYGVRMVRRASKSAHAALLINGQITSSRRKTVMLALAFTFLNPHVYLDTVILLGTLASTYHGMDRMAFACGAMLASTIWFAALGYGARLLQPLFAKPLAWRILDLVIGISMIVIASTLWFRAWSFFV